MRFATIIALAVLFPAAARAQSSTVAGTYPTTFEKVNDNCEGKGMPLSSETLVIEQSSAKVVKVTIQGLPSMTGTLGRGGQKLRAELKRGATKSAGMMARYGFNGSVDNGKLQAVLILEYYKDKKPVCTQSFSLSATRR